MTQQKISLYLICTKNRGHQRKHIEVCKRCPANHECKPFLEYSENEILAPSPIVSGDKTPDLPLPYIIEQLREIRRLIPKTDRLQSDCDHPQQGDLRHAAELMGYLKTELEEIKSLC